MNQTQTDIVTTPKPNERQRFILDAAQALENKHGYNPPDERHVGHFLAIAARWDLYPSDIMGDNAYGRMVQDIMAVWNFIRSQ